MVIVRNTIAACGLLVLLSACDNAAPPAAEAAQTSGPAAAPSVVPDIPSDETRPEDMSRVSRLMLESGLAINFWAHAGDDATCSVVRDAPSPASHVVSSHGLKDARGRSIAITRMGDQYEVILYGVDEDVLLVLDQVTEAVQLSNAIDIMGRWKTGNGADAGPGNVTLRCT